MRRLAGREKNDPLNAHESRAGQVARPATGFGGSMTTIAIFGGTGYAGSAITAEALKRGHRVISVTRSGGPPAGAPQTDMVEYRQGTVHDATLADQVAAEADVVVVSIRFSPDENELRLRDAIPTVSSACAAHDTRLGIVGGAASLHVTDGGPRLIDTPEFPDMFKGEAGSAADVLADLRTEATGVDWFFVSPAAGFGSYNPGVPTGKYRVGGDVLLSDESGKSEISGADFALAFVDEIDSPAHHRTRVHFAY
jgi:putative NADH-flavin reductase